MIYYIAYDISDTDARTQTAKQLESLGTRIQHSLFMCEMNPDQMEAVFKQLSALKCKRNGIGSLHTTSGIRAV